MKQDVNTKRKIKALQTDDSKTDYVSEISDYESSSDEDILDEFFKLRNWRVKNMFIKTKKNDKTKEKRHKK